MIRAFLIRYILPIAAALSLVAFVGVPYINRILAQWFQADVQLRAQLVMSSMRQPLSALLQTGDLDRAEAYLSLVTGDERLLGIAVCGAHSEPILQTALVPALAACQAPNLPPADRPAVLRTPQGLIELSRFSLATDAGMTFSVLLVHDLGFINRRQTTARNFALAVVMISASALALLAGLGTRLFLNRWISLLVGDIKGRRFLDDAKSSRVSLPVLTRVRQVMRELEAAQRLEIDFRENWTPQALQQVARDQLQSCPMLVISNREPYIHYYDSDGEVKVQVPASGMVTAIEPIMRACSGTWVAHGSGAADRATVDRYDHVQVPPDSPSYTLRRIWLTTEEEDGYYYGFSNEGLWPLCHLAYVRPAFRESDWVSYVRVNERFADSIVREAAASEESVILIQDFHFALLPQLIRDRGVRATIALFWHIPWPNAETFGICPWKHEILVHMLNADILGFHTLHHCQNFLATLDRFVECQVDQEHMTVIYKGHVCRIASYPISIESPPRWLAHMPDIGISRVAIRAHYQIEPHVRLGLGVERWDFTKGIIERLLALETLFRKEPRWLGHLTFIQIAAPSRSKLPTYQRLQEQTLGEVKRINEAYGTATWQPIVFVGEHREPAQVYELYRAADFCVTNSLHDGMNLVAKEFVAARDDEDGVLILSTFAGASRELVEALLVNPFDVSETAAAISAALQMSREERRKRMQLMRKTLSENNIYRWAGRMLMDVARIRQRRTLSGWLPSQGLSTDRSRSL